MGLVLLGALGVVKAVTDIDEDRSRPDTPADGGAHPVPGSLVTFRRFPTMRHLVWLDPTARSVSATEHFPEGL